MQFGNTDATIEQTNGCDSLQFSPPTNAIPLSENRKHANLIAAGYDLNVGNLANDLEVHREDYTFTTLSCKSGLALPAAGENKAQKRETLMAQRKASKRGESQPSRARCVGRCFVLARFISLK